MSEAVWEERPSGFRTLICRLIGCRWWKVAWWSNPILERTGRSVWIWTCRICDRDVYQEAEDETNRNCEVEE